MRPQDFTPRSPGSLLTVDSEGPAFVPHPLPPELAWSGQIVRLLGEAERALGELNGVGRRLPNPYLFTRPFVNREAVLSSRIEGTQASLSDLYALEAQVPRIRFHDLRHTAASLMIRRGIPPKTVSERLGHADVGFTLKTYTHLYDEQREEAAFDISDFFPRVGAAS
jgi:integrase